MTSSKIFLYYLFSLLLITSYAHTLDEQTAEPTVEYTVEPTVEPTEPTEPTADPTDEPICAHGLFPHDNEPLDVEEDFIIDDGRNLATTTYPNFRIRADYTRLTQGTAAFRSYVQNDLVPAVVDYFQAALNIKAPLKSNLRISSSTVCGGYAIPTALKNGVATDLFLLITATEDKSSNWVASAGACYISSATGRPIVARMMFNLAYTKAATDDVLMHERNMYLTMHEMIHALGFSPSSFSNFINSSGKKLTGHIKTVTIDGSRKWTAIDVEPLTSKLRKHFGCSSLPGAFMEDEGGSGTAGSHFERRHFLYETMTSGVIHGRRISEFSLAMLEGSGWYVPDYTYAEPFFFGQGQGCNFLYQTCDARSFNYEDFCTGSGRGCTEVGRGGGICSSDTRSNGCRYHIPVLDYDCENNDAADNARFPTREVFGREAGSKCFGGTLTTLRSSSATSFCFKYNCVGSGLNTKLEVMVGNTKATCTKEGNLTVSGLNGYLSCPDPLSFCNTVGKKYCPRGCLGRGTCVDGKCKCKTGYSGVDCALRN